MITDPDRFHEDKSPYERPNFPYRCGRIALWGKPCSRGPNGDGSCGGTSECMPFFDDGRWECRRAAHSGGPCENGPLPDGQCCKQHPPCKPTPTLRKYRARLAMLAAALVLALIGAFALNGDDARAISSISPGELTSKHAQFTNEKGCATCHAPHGGGAAGWIRAAWSPSTLTQSCGSCHGFDGPAATAHNEVFEKSEDQRHTQCTMCHTEHIGADANIVQLADQQCAACHKVKFTSFSGGHPPFSENYPSRRRTAITYNHTSHFAKHFVDKRFAARAPKARCVTCHDTRKASRNVPVAPFKETCAACHKQQIPDRDLIIFTLPEFEKDPFDAAALAEACGPVAQTDRDEEYESVSSETLPPVAVMLLGLEEEDDSEAYREPVRDLIMGMIENGIEPLVESVEGRPDADMLFAGLSPDLLRRAGCAWAANQEYEAPGGPKATGWYADELSLRYRPLRHGDSVARAWILLTAAGGDGIGEEMRDAVLSRSEGPGACTKCHSVNAEEGESDKLQISWKFGAQSEQRHLRAQPETKCVVSNACETHCHTSGHSRENGNPDLSGKLGCLRLWTPAFASVTVAILDSNLLKLHT